MWERVRPFVNLAALALTFAVPLTVRAECGGFQDCIAVSTDPGVAPSHGTPLVASPVGFGNQTIATPSAPRTVLVAGVAGSPIGSLATITAITLSGPDASDFAIATNACVVGVPSLVQDGAVQASPANACGITVTFVPATLGTKSAQLLVSSSVITRTVPLTGTGTALAPGATSTSLIAERGRRASIDLAPFVSGQPPLTLVIASGPSNGTAELAGTVLTYTPNAGFVGADTLTFTTSNVVGTSAPATLSISVVLRADPAEDPTVVGVVSAQTEALRRFSSAQIGNVRHRLRSLHRQRGQVAQSATTGVAAGGSAGPGREAGSAPAERDGRDTDPLLSALARPLTRLATSGAVDLAAAGGDGLPTVGDGFGFWVGGRVRFGTFDQTANSGRLRFNTEGVSAGVDRPFGDNLILGLGFGVARDETDVGFDGSRTEADALSVMAYGSYQPTREIALDALVGYGTTSLESSRFVASTGTHAFSERDGDQWFGSLAAAYDIRTERTLFSPYVRFDFAHDSLDQATELGAGGDSLTYLARSFDTWRLGVGLRAASRHAMRLGWVEPRAFVEYQHDFEDDRPAGVVYADDPDGPRSLVAPASNDRNALHLGVGSDFVLRDGTRLGLDYDVVLLASRESSQALRFWLSKEFDGPRVDTPPPARGAFENPINVEAGWTWDDNLNRTRNPEKLYDHAFAVNVSQSIPVPLSSNSRLLARWSVGGEKFAAFADLDRVSAGLHAEFQYRPSGAYGAPTFGLFARGTFEEFESGLRDGYRYGVGINARKLLTDRVQVFAALAYDGHDADSKVFDGHQWSARMNLDYTLGRSGTFYLAGEYREGDTVSSTSAPLTATWVADRAYDGRSLFASRFDARTKVLTLGYNYPLGQRDSIDFSWTRAHSEPTGGQSFLPDGPYGPGAGGSRSYVADRYSIFYLMRF